MLYIADVLVESRIDSHVFGPHGKPFSVLVFIFYIEHEGDTGRVLAHHLLQETHCEVDTLDD